MSEFLILLAIVCVPINFLIWIIKLKKAGKCIKEGHWGESFFTFVDFIIDLGGTIFITVVSGGGITALMVGGIGGLVLTALLYIFGFTPRK